MEAVGRYRGVMKRLVRAYKDEPAPPVAPLVESLLAEVLGRSLDPADPALPPVLIPVPMARVRRRQRGFNPPELLAEALGRRFGLPVRRDGIRRIRFHRPLKGLPAPERRKEMAGAFAPTAELSNLRGRRVWLVDDVLTTGATLLAVRSALREGGCEVERAFTLARTPRPGRNIGRKLPS